MNDAIAFGFGPIMPDELAQFVVCSGPCRDLWRKRDFAKGPPTPFAAAYFAGKNLTGRSCPVCKRKHGKTGGVR